MLYTCTTLGRQNRLCGSAGRIKVIQGMQIFDITLVLQNVTVADSGMYTAVIEAIRPDTGATASVSKGFDVVIEGTK